MAVRVMAAGCRIADDPSWNEAVIATVDAFTPRLEVVRPGWCVFEARGPARYFGGEERLAMLVRDEINKRLGKASACVGSGVGIFTALLAAEHDLVVSNEKTAEFLSHFSVHEIDAPVLTDLLERLGLTTLGAFASIPHADVMARFGAQGALAHRLAQGRDDSMLRPRVAPLDLTVTVEIDPPAERVDMAAFAAKSAADELAQKLSEAALACTRLTIEAQTEHGETMARTWRYSSAFTAAAVAERVRWQFDGWMSSAEHPTGGLILLRLVPGDVTADTGSPVGFWGRAGDVSDRVRRSLHRVQEILGHEGVGRPVLSGGRDHHEQVSLVAWGDPVEPQRPGLPGNVTVTSAVGVEMPPWPGRLPAPAPAVLHDPQPQVELMDAQKSAVRVTGRGDLTAVPSTLRLDGKWHEVISWAGPWPSQRRWWDESGQSRRARVQVVLSDGSAHLLSAHDGGWTLEATYD